MKKILAAFLAFLCFSCLNTSFSQEMYSKEYVIQKSANFSEFFNLDESTKQKVFYYVFDNNEKLKLLQIEVANMLPAEFSEQQKVLRIELEMNLFTLLTAEQILLYPTFADQSSFF